jgi:tRNA(Arg) A34 adenosine deaminase TadA
MDLADTFLRQAIDLALANVTRGGRPFGAVLVKDGEVIATGVNEMLDTGDPTAHAELQAVRAASRVLGSLRLEGTTMYASGHPCPMCLAAMYLTGVQQVFCAYSNEDAERYGLSTAPIYAELAKGPAKGRLPVVCVPARADCDLYETWLTSTARPAE